MAYYCARCGKEIPTGTAVFEREDGSADTHGRPFHPECAPGARPAAPAPGPVAGPAVRCTADRLVLQRLDPQGGVEGWLELPESLKQPLMAMVADVARGRRERAEFPVPGGDRLVVNRLPDRGALELRREPTGFPPQGRHVLIDAVDVDRFVAQCRAV